MNVVIVLWEQPCRDQVIVAGEWIDDIIVIRHGDLDRGRLISSTVPQRCARSPCLVYATGKDDEASATDLHGGEKQSQRDRGIDPESVEDVEE